MTNTMIRRFCVLGAALVAIAMPFAQYAGVLGLSPAEFSSSGDSTLRAASYAFAIWGLIYTGLGVYALYQVRPGLADENLLRRFGWPSVISLLAIGLWLVAAANDWRWATVALIVLAAAMLIVPLARPPRDVSWRDALLVITPLALLAGWLTIASGLNAITVLTSEGIVTETSALWWALGGIAASSAVTMLVYLRGRAHAYPIPVIWGLIAVFAAERTHRPEAAWFAMACAGTLLLALAWGLFATKRQRFN